MEHYGKPDWDQTLTIIRVNEGKKISERISGTYALEKNYDNSKIKKLHIETHWVRIANTGRYLNSSIR